MPGIRGIAERAGVSISTVSNVLHHKNSASEKTREKIFAIAEELGYEMPVARERGSRTIIVNLSDFDTLYYLDILRGISDYAYSRGYSFLICTGESFAHFAEPEMICGCIVNDVNTGSAVLKKIADKGIPVVALDRDIDHRRIKSITVNNYPAEKQLIERLIETGYRRFSFLGGLNTSDTRERYAAFRDALKENGLTFHRNDYYEGDWREKSGAQAARLLMLSEEMPEILICANDMMAIGAIRRFKDDGLRIPEDIAVTGFDDIIISRYIELTTVAVPDYERGFLATQALIDILEGKGDFDPVRIGARVKWRKTTKEFS